MRTFTRYCRYEALGCAKWARPNSSVCEDHAASQRRLRSMRARFAVAQNMICPYCETPLPDDLLGTHIDHIIPVRMGGPDDLWNIQLLHGPCSAAKGGQITAAAFAVAKAQGINIWGLARGEGWYSPSWR